MDKDTIFVKPIIFPGQTSMLSVNTLFTMDLTHLSPTNSWKWESPSIQEMLTGISAASYPHRVCKRSHYRIVISNFYHADRHSKVIP